MARIERIEGRWVVDSRGNPTLDVEVFSERYSARFMVPSGASTGSHEALELRDGGKAFHGKGVSKAIRNLKKIEKRIRGMDVGKQEEIDSAMIELDGTPNKSRLGANAILGVSVAVARLAAIHRGVEFWAYLSEYYGREPSFPVPMFNVINGGVHAASGLAIQEFMLVPQLRGIEKRIRAGVEIYQELKQLIASKYGKKETRIGDEGGFAPRLKKTTDALDLLVEAIDNTGYSRKVWVSLDAAASEFYDGRAYRIDGKRLSGDRLADLYLSLAEDYPIYSVEDPFHEEDFEGFARLNEEADFLVVGDDLTVTNPERVSRAIESNAISALLMKLNQIGTLTEFMEAFDLCESHSIVQIASHRSGETEDDYLADISYGLGFPLLKAGAPARGERTAKYNRLLRIANGF